MKNLYNFGFVVLLLVVLGCNCQKLKDLAEKGKETPAPASSPTSSSSPSKSSTSNAPASSSSKASLTKANFEKIKTGMSRSEVAGIIGGDGDEISSSEIGKYKTSTIQWKGEDFAYIYCVFQNDKMISKTSANLK